MRHRKLTQSEIENFATTLNLTESDIKIIELICKEYNSSEIATKLKLSRRTIEGKRERILQKTKSKNVVGMVKYAVKNKIFIID